MLLLQWLEGQSYDADWLARSLQIRAGAAKQLIYGYRRVKVEEALAIERLTGGDVQPEDLAGHRAKVARYLQQKREQRQARKRRPAQGGAL